MGLLFLSRLKKVKQTELTAETCMLLLAVLLALTAASEVGVQAAG